MTHHIKKISTLHDRKWSVWENGTVLRLDLGVHATPDEAVLACRAALPGEIQVVEPAARKGSWEAVFGHLGTPDEVGNEWHRITEQRDLAIALLKRALPYVRQEYIKMLDSAGSLSDAAFERVKVLPVWVQTESDYNEIELMVRQAAPPSVTSRKAE